MFQGDTDLQSVSVKKNSQTASLCHPAFSLNHLRAQLPFEAGEERHQHNGCGATQYDRVDGEYARFDVEEDAIVFRRLAGKEDWLAVLKECPVSMDDVPPRRRETARRRKL